MYNGRAIAGCRLRVRSATFAEASEGGSRRPAGFETKWQFKQLFLTVLRVQVVLEDVCRHLAPESITRHLIESEVNPAIHPCVVDVVAHLVERRVGESEIGDRGIVRVGQCNRVTALAVDPAQDFSRAVASAGVIRRVAREARRGDEGVHTRDPGSIFEFP